MMLELLVPLAAISMLGQDLIGSNLVISESKGQAVLAGLLDVVGWLLTVTTMTISVDSLSGHDLGLKIAVITAVSFANFIGTWLGVKIGHRHISNKES